MIHTLGLQSPYTSPTYRQTISGRGDCPRH